MAKSKKPSTGARKKSGAGRKGVTLPDIPNSVADATGTPKVAGAAKAAATTAAAKAADTAKTASKITDADRAKAKAVAAQSKAAAASKAKASTEAKVDTVKTAAASSTPKVAVDKAVDTKTVETATAKVNTPSSLAKTEKPAAQAKPEVSQASTTSKAAETTAEKSVSSTAAAVAPAPVVEKVIEKRSGGFLPIAAGVGGAAVLGFLTSEFNWFGLRDDAGGNDFAAEISRQQEQIDALKAAQEAAGAPDLSGISTSVETLKSDMTAQIEGVSEKIGGLETQFAEVGETLTGFEARVAEVEKRPMTGDTDAGKEAFEFYEKKFDDLTASVEDQGQSLVTQFAGLTSSFESQGSELESRFDALQASVEEQKVAVAAQKEVIDGLVAEAKSAEEAAEAAAQVANMQVAVAKITSAVNKGEPYAPALAELEAAGANEIPAVLTENAEEGVPSVDMLKAQFPAAASAALQVARVVAPSEEEAGVGGFLKRQLGARSVVPREGNSPDAVLSRAEEAVRNGALDQAFDEIEALPAEAQEKLQDWLAAAQARQAAETAVQDLSQSLMAN